VSLRHAILAVLSSRPRTGYELVHSIDGSIGFFWSATHQQVYKELQALEKAQWVRHREVAQAAKPDKKVFRITDSGLKELKRWVAEDDEGDAPPVRDALLIRCWAGHLAPPGALARALEQQRKKRQERLATYRLIEREHFSGERARMAPPDRFKYLTLRRGILIEEAWLKWAEEAKALISDLC
jgi:DNA-binding PadR family transcriptional regulator